MSALYTRTSAPLVLRDRTQLAELLAGWELLPPGIVDGPTWWPDPGDPVVPNPGYYAFLAGLARLA